MTVAAENPVREFARRFPCRVEPGGREGISSLTGAADAFCALAMCAGPAPRLVLAVTAGIPDAERLASDLETLAARPVTDGAPPPRILEFPPKTEDDRSALGARLRTVAAVRAWGENPYPAVVVASCPSLSQPVPKGVVPALDLVASAEAKFSDVCARLAELGYGRVPSVLREGDYSVRGGIVDAWSPGEEFPVRAEFFGDELESLRTFDAATQRSIARIDAASFMPVSERGDAAECSLADLLPDGAAVFAIEHATFTLPPIDAKKAAALAFVYAGDPAPAGVPHVRFATVSLPGFSELGVEEAHHPELFEAARERLDRHLKASERGGATIARIDGLSGGFEIAGEGAGAFVVVTKADRAFTKRRAPVRRAAASVAGERVSEIEDLEPGEYVVHVDYGVGRYLGSSEIVQDGRRCEVFALEYADGAKLYVPATHAHLLTRYVGVKGEAVRLHRLDGKRWAKDRVEAQRAVADLAAALLETQAKRETAPGFEYDVACDGLDAFEAAFPYEETPDQLAAIEAVKRDLASRKPMDRLICGDAGYGKTEVAMRAAYIAALNGKQTAVLAPTTVLAEQHFETFTARFDGTPVRIESVSRFQSAGTHKGTFGRLASGACDIVIGTHAILSSKIAFHDLGLIVIDEEQRFGVRHKAFLKRLRATADVLTLSATPIPRTLYLSMTGARDLSQLRTPPRERVAVDTRIVVDSDEIVRSAIEAELARGGQVFFLHNRVASIGKVEKRLKALCPSVKVTVAHGQMDAVTLARKMRDFERGKFDLLLSTTIVESGIDIPRANTILIDHAETFGLADLYQLRGRVGRSSREGRALFLLPASGVDSDARERMKALQRHGGLGGGFGLAVRDLELRGAGNLLGAQQSGHIAAVGFTLYCQLLKRTVARLKGERVNEVVDVRLNFDFIDLSPATGDEAAAATIPYAYVEEDAQRLGFMKRVAEAGAIAEVRALGSEMEDRFGRMPPGVRRFLKIAELRIACASRRIARIDVRGPRAIFYRTNSDAIAFVRDLKGKSADRKIAEIEAAVKAQNDR